MSQVATAREAREWLLARKNDGQLPEGVEVGNRGRLSVAAKEHFAQQTGREVASPVTVAAE